MKKRKRQGKKKKKLCPRIYYAKSTFYTLFYYIVRKSIHVLCQKDKKAIHSTKAAKESRDGKKEAKRNAYNKQW